MKPIAALPISLVLAGLGACSPALDWRETAAEGSGVVAMFPCRPDRHARSVELVGAKLKMVMLVCPAAGSTYALSFVDVPDPARVNAALVELRAAALRNVQAPLPSTAPAQVAGMTPNAEAVRLSASGRLPDGVAVQVHAVFFAKGLRVYQGSVIGAKVAAEANEVFFAGFRFPA
ncbi:MAG: hypothetical protein ABL916_24810 [Burkholderiaceae bacterium]